MEQILVFFHEVSPVLTPVCLGVLLWLGKQVNTLAAGYAEEKGKNLATKEDVDSVLRMVEEMKKEVEVSLQAHVDVDRAEREALLDFIDSVATFLGGGQLLSLIMMLESLDTQTVIMRQQMEQYDRIFRAFVRVSVFCHNREVVERAEGLLAALAKACQGNLSSVMNLSLARSKLKENNIEPFTVALHECAKQFNENLLGCAPMFREFVDATGLHINAKKLTGALVVSVDPPAG